MIGRRGNRSHSPKVGFQPAFAAKIRAVLFKAVTPDASGPPFRARDLVRRLSGERLVLGRHTVTRLSHQNLKRFLGQLYELHYPTGLTYVSH